MLKELVNECRITFSITTEGPVLIKGQENNRNKFMEEINNSYNSKGENSHIMLFIRSLKNDQYVPFIPGSSLKGVFRSHCEKITRSLMPLNSDESKLGCCNPFIDRKDNNIAEIWCAEKFQLRKDKSGNGFSSPKLFKESCPICRLFGNTFIQSRILFPDGYLSSTTHMFQRRDGVGIDRFSGSSAIKESGGAKFAFEVLEDAVFKFETIIIRNFDLWQLGLLAYLFQDFKDKFIKIGYGKSRGLGMVSGKVEKIEFVYFGSRKPADRRLAGVSDYADFSDYYSDEEHQAAHLKAIAINKTSRTNSYKHVYSFTTTGEIEGLLNTVSATFSANDNSGFLNGSYYKIPKNMQKSNIKQIIKELNEENNQ